MSYQYCKNPSQSQSEKLQKVLARQGIASRRTIETWIAAGRIKVNKRIAKIGDRVTSKDKILFDNKELKCISHLKTRVLIYNKPEGEICTRSDPEKRRTVFASLPKLTSGRWIAVGRLDINSSGLLLFTNDGCLANKLMHPKTMLEREYLVRVFGEVDDKSLNELIQGVKLSDGYARFKSVKRVDKKSAINQWFKVVITEGRNRLVRRLWNTKNISVNRLIRIRFYTIVLPSSLKTGDFRELKEKEIEYLEKL